MTIAETLHTSHSSLQARQRQLQRACRASRCALPLLLQWTRLMPCRSGAFRLAAAGEGPGPALGLLLLLLPALLPTFFACRPPPCSCSCLGMKMAISSSAAAATRELAMAAAEHAAAEAAAAAAAAAQARAKRKRKAAAAALERKQKKQRAQQAQQQLKWVTVRLPHVAAEGEPEEEVLVGCSLFCSGLPTPEPDALTDADGELRKLLR